MNSHLLDQTMTTPFKGFHLSCVVQKHQALGTKLSFCWGVPYYEPPHPAFLSAALPLCTFITSLDTHKMLNH